MRGINNSSVTPLIRAAGHALQCGVAKRCNSRRVNRLYLAIAPVAACAAIAFVSAPARAERLSDPLRFFEGRTESISTVKLIMKKPFRSRSVGRGVIKPDGSLELVQEVEENNEPTKTRRWKIRQVGPGKFSGTMSEARGPVTIEEVGGRYRFRFKMKGDLSVEQWLTPTANGLSGLSVLTIKKFGMKVGSSEGRIRKVN